MKAIQIGGAIKKYTKVPKEWGAVIGGFDLLSDDELKSYGFYDIVSPSYDSATQHLGDIEWDEANSVFTYPVIDKTWTQTVAELKANKIANLKSIYNTKLSETDWYIVRSQEGISVPQEILDARSALRSECATKENEINALTTKKAVVSYSLPNFI